jgi:hypothetical protein
LLSAFSRQCTHTVAKMQKIILKIEEKKLEIKRDFPESGNVG